MDKFDEHEVCPACGNDPIESGLKWIPRWKPPKTVDGVQSGNHIVARCGQCRYLVDRALVNEV